MAHSINMYRPKEVMCLFVFSVDLENGVSKIVPNHTTLFKTYIRNMNRLGPAPENLFHKIKWACQTSVGELRNTMKLHVADIWAPMFNSL